jgi:hypothetical protein
VLQSLADPLFAVPFLLSLGVGVLGVVVGAAYRWWAGRRATARVAHLRASAGGLGLAGIGVASVALGFDYAGTQARLLDGTGIEPSLVGRLGRLVPWELVAAGVGIPALAGVCAAMALAAVADHRDEPGES